LKKDVKPLKSEIAEAERISEKANPAYCLDYRNYLGRKKMNLPLLDADCTLVSKIRNKLAIIRTADIE